MEYQVWTHDEYEGWKKVDCGDIEAARREVQKALLSGKEPLLTAAVPYNFNIKIEEGKIGEAPKGKAKRDKDTGVKGEGEVRPGAPETVSGVGEGSGDSSPGDSMPGE